MQKYEQILGFAPNELSLNYFIELHNKLRDHTFDPDNYSCFHHDENPNNNPVAKTVSEFRDQFLLKSIRQFWKEKKNLFIVYGIGHAMKLKEAITNL